MSGALLSSTLLAAGLYLAPPGIRSQGRGGAFVAGAEGPLALAYNPAGLHGDEALAVDVTVPLFDTAYTRTIAGVEQPTVHGSAVSPVVPSLGVVHGLGLSEALRFGFAFLTEVPSLQSWPAGGPQRYALHDFRGSALSKAALGAAYRLNEWLTAGVSLQLITGVLSGEGTVSTCDGVVCTLPEDPEYDAVARVTTGILHAPGVQVGVIATPHPLVRLGLSWESGYTISDDAARLELRIPSAAAYDDATLDPEEPTVSLSTKLPMRLRAGLEARSELLRVEASFVWEPWSVHDGISIDASHVVIHDVSGFGDYRGSKVHVARELRDTWSARLGGELQLPVGVARAGVAYEPSAFPDTSLTALTVDLDKVALSLGAGVDVGVVHLDVAYAYYVMIDREVTRSEARQINPGRPPYPGATTIGEGTYSASAHLFGVAASYRF